jgi:hypothetical protein
MFPLPSRTSRSNCACLILALLTWHHLPARQLNPPIFHISLGALQRALNAGDKVEVPVKCSFAGQFASLEVCGWITDTGTLGPELMAACTGERAGAC